MKEIILTKAQRSSLQVAACQSFFRWAIRDGQPPECALAIAIVKSSDDAFADVWDDPRKLKALQKWIQLKLE